MRVLFGVVSLLIVLAIVGLLAKNQLRAVDKSIGASLPPAQASSATGPAVPPANAREQSQQLQQRVTDDVNKALKQAAERNEAADK